MPFTTREIENPDPVTRVVAADAAMRNQKAEQAGDDIGEKMVLNMGPSHPATHGVLRLVLELDGEIITKATPDVGFLHRGDERFAICRRISFRNWQNSSRPLAPSLMNAIIS